MQSSTFCSFQAEEQVWYRRQKGRTQGDLFMVPFPDTFPFYIFLLFVSSRILFTATFSKRTVLSGDLSFLLSRCNTTVRILTCGTVFNRLLNDSAAHLASYGTSADSKDVLTGKNYFP